MTPEAQRIAIAEACGWTKCERTRSAMRIWVKDQRRFAYLEKLPDYLNDLNAMHEAEKTIDPDEYANYEQQLRNTYPVCMGGGFHLLNATASQRACAFLKTLNLWKDED